LRNCAGNFRQWENLLDQSARTDATAIAAATCAIFDAAYVAFTAAKLPA
jgi:hypothetical protein